MYDENTHTVVTGIDDSTSVHTYNMYVTIVHNESLNKNTRRELDDEMLYCRIYCLI